MRPGAGIVTRQCPLPPASHEAMTHSLSEQPATALGSSHVLPHSPPAQQPGQGGAGHQAQGRSSQWTNARRWHSECRADTPPRSQLLVVFSRVSQPLLVMPSQLPQAAHGRGGGRERRAGWDGRGEESGGAGVAGIHVPRRVDHLAWSKARQSTLLPPAPPWHLKMTHTPSSQRVTALGSEHFLLRTPPARQSGQRRRQGT